VLQVWTERTEDCKRRSLYKGYGSANTLDGKIFVDNFYLGRFAGFCSFLKMPILQGSDVEVCIFFDCAIASLHARRLWRRWSQW
jgi:hypothetical protein